MTPIFHSACDNITLSLKGTCLSLKPFGWERHIIKACGDHAGTNPRSEDITQHRLPIRLGLCRTKSIDGVHTSYKHSLTYTITHYFSYKPSAHILTLKQPTHTRRNTLCFFRVQTIRCTFFVSCMWPLSSRGAGEFKLVNGLPVMTAADPRWRRQKCHYGVRLAGSFLEENESQGETIDMNEIVTSVKLSALVVYMKWQSQLVVF